MKLSQADLANGLGVSRRSIARTLTQWIRRGLLGKSGTSYVVKDLGAVAALGTPDLIGIDWVAGSGLGAAAGAQR